MRTKIDIGSLCKKTQTKLKKMADRCKALSKGVTIEINVPKIKNIVIWQDGTECCACHIDAKNIDWKSIQKQQDMIVAKYNTEIKEIIKFSDSCADSLGVDRAEFFDRFLAH